MTQPISRLRIAGAELPIETHHLSCSVRLTCDGRGRRKIEIAATGIQPPTLTGVGWTGAVVIEWRDITSAEGGWQSLSVLSPGPQLSTDMAAITVAWSLSGIEAAENGSAVMIGGTPYWARVETSPLGGVIQRKTNGSGTLLRAWDKLRVTLTGESVSAPSAAGLVAIISPLYTGNLLCFGVSCAESADSGLTTWSLNGEEP